MHRRLFDESLCEFFRHSSVGLYSISVPHSGREQIPSEPILELEVIAICHLAMNRADKQGSLVLSM